MTGSPPSRPVMRTLLLAIALVAAACASVRPAPTPTPSPGGVGPSAPPATAPPPAGDPSGSLLALRQGRLFQVDPGGAVDAIAGPGGGQIEQAATAAGAIAVRTADQVLHVATVPETDVTAPDWRAIAIDDETARRPLSLMALSPDARHLAILAASFGSGEPFEVILVDLWTAATRVVAVAREPNGPPIWLDWSTVLLEVVAGAAGGPFLRLDVGTGNVEGVAARGFGPAIAGEGSSVVLPDEAGGVRVLTTVDWLAGAEPGSGEALGAPDNVLAIAVDSTGHRLAAIVADSAGEPEGLAVYRRDGGGWALIGRITDGATRWIGWLR